MDKTKCQEARLRETRIIKEAAARNAVRLPAQLNAKWFEEDTENRPSPTAHHENAEGSDPNTFSNEHGTRHGAPKPSTWENKTDLCCRNDTAERMDADGVEAGVGVGNRYAEEHRSPRNLSSSGEVKGDTGATSDSNITKSRKRASACFWNGIWGADDEILEGFLNRHAEGTGMPGEGVDRQPLPETEIHGLDGGRAEVGNGALRSPRGLKLLW